jgi:hypothetical protein
VLAASIGDAKPQRLSIALGALGLALAGALFGLVLFKHLSYPMIWHDEALTVVFGERVLAYGYPKVHGPEGAHYPMHHDLSVGVKEGIDAYVGSPWAQYYFAALGVAWAEGVPDWYAKTLRLRLPFAIAGGLGLAILLVTALGSLESGGRRGLFALLFLLLASYSVSLVLHLREARYYPLVVLTGACALHLTVRHRLRGELSLPLYTTGLAGVLFLLFNTFYLAFVGLFAGLVLHATGSALAEGGFGRRRRLWRELLPLFVAGVAILPLLSFYDTFSVASAFSEAYAGPKNEYVNKLRWLLMSLLRYELLAPAATLRLAVWLRIRRADTAEIPPWLRERLRLAGLLATVIACYGVVVAAAPFFYERYSILLSPLLTLVMLLDAFSLRDLLGVPVHSRWRRDVSLALAAVAAAAFCASLWLRVPEFRGRLHEIRHVYRGPLDFLVPYLTERYPQLEDLTIATNYEDPSLRYYLGSRVIVGWFNPHLEHDLTLDPDVIVPRPGGKNLRALRLLASRGSFDAERLSVQNLHANNVPFLAPWNHSRWVHRFETPLADADGGNALLILERRGDDGTAAPPRTAPGSGEAPAPTARPPE